MIHFKSQLHKSLLSSHRKVKFGLNINISMVVRSVNHRAWLFGFFFVIIVANGILKRGI